MRKLLVCAILLFVSDAGAAGRGEANVLSVRVAQAELRGRPSLDSAVTGLVRRGETVEVLRTSADGRWIEVEIGAGELAWIEARALKSGAATAEPERGDTLRMHRPAWARRDDERRSDDDGRRRSESRRVEEPPPPSSRAREEPRDTQDDPPPPLKREVRNDPPPPPKREVRNDPPRSPKREAREQAPPPRPAQREIPPAKPGEVFAADLDDERPPTRPGEATKRAK